MIAQSRYKIMRKLLILTPQVRNKEKKGFGQNVPSGFQIGTKDRWLRLSRTKQAGIKRVNGITKGDLLFEKLIFTGARWL